MDLWRHDGTAYVPWPGASGLTVASVAHGDSTRFTVTTRVPYTGDVTRLLLTLRKTGGGVSNPYLSDSSGIAVTTPQFARNDMRTVQKYGWTEIDVLGNDVLPSSLFAGPFSLADSVVKAPLAGSLHATGTGAGSRLVYINGGGTDGLPDHIDSLVYRFRVFDPVPGILREFRATVYIYLPEDRHGAASCYSRPFTAQLTERPAGVTFRWLNVADSVEVGVGASHNFGTLTGDASRLVQPAIPDGPWNRDGGFPPGRFTVHVMQPAPAPMRWTGLANTDWFNPANWVETVTDGGMKYESPVLWPPAACTEVEISSGAYRYPALTDSAWCRTVMLRDRALLGNPHALNYDSAGVELKLKATERDRFVMWSAPLKDMYSGDYHFKNAAGKPQWGDVRMNYFQLASPDVAGGQAYGDMFTAAFGNPGDPLTPGRAFNVQVTGTTVSRGVSWLFPQTETSYTPLNGSPVGTPRTRSHRFITDGLVPDATGRFGLPVQNDVAGGRFVQVVNPYPAWLHADSFLLGNAGQLATAGYLIWDGRVNSSFIAARVTGKDSMRYSVSTAAAANDVRLIPPLQSFFAVKLNPANKITSVRMSPRWTTTVSPEESVSGYTLRAAAAERGVLRVRAVRNGSTGHAALHYDVNALPGYGDREDVRCLFYDASPLTLYFLTPLREPLSIHADGGEGLREAALGLRVSGAGTVKLTFEGLETFGHNVYLIDRGRDGYSVDLQQTPEYEFTVTGGGVMEVNDRLELRMEYTGHGLANAPAAASAKAAFSGRAGHVHVRALSGTLHSVRVYNLQGMLIRAENVGAVECAVPVAAAQTYIVRAEVDGTAVTAKVFVGD
jgi:hypothetical protein